MNYHRQQNAAGTAVAGASRFYRRALPQALLAALLVLVGCTTTRHDTLTQYSTINALLAGVYDGDLTFGELRRQGDFGLGTFNDLDGEMLALAGRFYQLKSDGTVKPVADDCRTPFAMVTFFQPETTLTITGVTSFATLERTLDTIVPVKNRFYAIKITGTFRHVKARSVPRQQPPYPPLLVATKSQSIFEFYDVAGTLVGFRMPEFVQGLNLTGYHFHFLTADHSAGGHVLDLQCATGQVEFDSKSRLALILPQHGTFVGTDLAKSRKQDLEAAEHGQAAK